MPARVREDFSKAELTRNQHRETLRRMRLALLCLLPLVGFPPVSRAQVPVFVITPADSSIKFYVKASVAIKGGFEKWSAELKFKSPDVSIGVLDIRIRAASVNTGSHFKNDRLRGKDFFDVARDPLITFRSTKIVHTGPDTFDVQGNFTIRGVTKPDTLLLTVFSNGKNSGEVKGTMAFDRRDYGINSRIPFIRIADRVEVTLDLKMKRVSGPPLVFNPMSPI